MSQEQGHLSYSATGPVDLRVKTGGYRYLKLGTPMRLKRRPSQGVGGLAATPGEACLSMKTSGERSTAHAALCFCPAARAIPVWCQQIAFERVGYRLTPSC